MERMNTGNRRVDRPNPVKGVGRKTRTARALTILVMCAAALAVFSAVSCENLLSGLIAKDEEYSKNLLGFSVEPGNDRWITGHETIKIVFDDAVITSTLELSGTLGIADENLWVVDWATGTQPNDTLYLDPERIGGLWEVGTDRTVVLSATSATGKVVENRIVLFDVEYAVCVDDTATNVGIFEDGTIRFPFGEIQAGMDAVNLIYAPGTATTIPVRVAVGTYSKDCNYGTSWVANLPVSVSLDGGYRADFTGYASSGVTELNNTGAATLGPSYYSPTSVIYCGPSVTSGAEVKNLTVRPGGNSSSTGIHGGIHINGSNPVIRNITVEGVNSGGPPDVVGIAIQGSCSPVIEKPDIDPGHGTNASIGLVVGNGATPTVSGTDTAIHWISAGRGVNHAYGIFYDYNGGGSVSGITIAGPSDYVPTGSIIFNNKGGCVYLAGGLSEHSTYPTITTNKFTMHGDWNLHVVFEGGNYGNPVVFTYNDFALDSSNGVWYQDFTVGEINESNAKTNDITFSSTTAPLVSTAFENYSSTRNIHP